jgi:hypothetical protein
VNVKIINIKDENGSLLLKIEGNILFRSYKELQTNYEDVTETITKTNELEIVEQSLDIKSGNFKVDLKWKI